MKFTLIWYIAHVNWSRDTTKIQCCRHIALHKSSLLAAFQFFLRNLHPASLWCINNSYVLCLKYTDSFYSFALRLINRCLNMVIITISCAYIWGLKAPGHHRGLQERALQRPTKPADASRGLGLL